MPELLISAGDGDFLVVGGDMIAALHPDGFGCVKVEGWGDHRMRCGSVEVGIGFEDPGRQLVMDGAVDDATADGLADAIAANVAATLGRSVCVVAL